MNPTGQHVFTLTITHYDPGTSKSQIPGGKADHSKEGNKGGATVAPSGGQGKSSQSLPATASSSRFYK